MDRLTRKELKSDRFALEVQHSVEYVAEHRRQLIRWGSVGAAVLVVVLAVYWYVSHSNSVREADLAAALNIENANVGPAPNEFTTSFATQDEKDKATMKAWTEILAKYPGSDAGTIAEYYLGTEAADKGDTAQAEKRFKAAADSGKSDYASLAKVALAQLYAGTGRVKDAETLLHQVMDHPTALVSKDEATIVLARAIAPARPDEAIKMLQPLAGKQDHPGVSQAAISAMSDIRK